MDRAPRAVGWSGQCWYVLDSAFQCPLAEAQPSPALDIATMLSATRMEVSQDDPK